MRRWITNPLVFALLASLLSMAGAVAGDRLRWQFNEGEVLQYRNTLRFEESVEAADGTLLTRKCKTEIEERSIRVVTRHTAEVATVATTLIHAAGLKHTVTTPQSEFVPMNMTSRWDSARPELGWEPELQGVENVRGLEVLFTMSSNNVPALKRLPPATEERIKELQKKPGLDYVSLLDLRVPWEFIVFPDEELEVGQEIEVDHYFHSIEIADSNEAWRSRMMLRFDCVKQDGDARIAWFTLSRQWDPPERGGPVHFPSKPLPSDLFVAEPVLEEVHAGGRLAFDLTHGRIVLFERCGWYRLSRPGSAKGEEVGGWAFRCELLPERKE